MQSKIVTLVGIMMLSLISLNTWALKSSLGAFNLMAGAKGKIPWSDGYVQGSSLMYIEKYSKDGRPLGQERLCQTPPNPSFRDTSLEYSTGGASGCFEETDKGKFGNLTRIVLVPKDENFPKLEIVFLDTPTRFADEPVGCSGQIHLKLESGSKGKYVLAPAATKAGIQGHCEVRSL